jgi:hypothetical protein
VVAAATSGDPADVDDVTPPAASESFAAELRSRIAMATSALADAEAGGDELLAQIAESDLADLRALAERNDVALEAEQPA